MIGKRLSKSLLTQNNHSDSQHHLNGLSQEEKLKALSMLQKLKDDGKSQGFRKPVAWKKLGLLNYPLIIPQPMDLSTVEKKLKKSEYKFIQEYLDDLQLIWSNCKTFNLEGSVIYEEAVYMENFTAQLIKQNFSVEEIQASQKRLRAYPNNLLNSPQKNQSEIQKKNNFLNSTENVEISESNQNFNINKAGESNIHSVEREHDNK
jgi:hypothetical protein